MSGMFGKVISNILIYKDDEWSEILSRLGFYLGKFVYLMDAYEDVEDDIRKGMYNPLKKLYDSPDFDEECRTILTMMMSECCKEFEKLPILENVEILRNILYSGVWRRYEEVKGKRSKAKAKAEAKAMNKAKAKTGAGIKYGAGAETGAGTKAGTNVESENEDETKGEKG
jgi:hypothetical protein